jgi:hypothetical protein
MPVISTIVVVFVVVLVDVGVVLVVEMAVAENKGPQEPSDKEYHR